MYTFVSYCLMAIDSLIEEKTEQRAELLRQKDAFLSRGEQLRFKETLSPLLDYNDGCLAGLNAAKYAIENGSD